MNLYLLITGMGSASGANIRARLPCGWPGTTSEGRPASDETLIECADQRVRDEFRRRLLESPVDTTETGSTIEKSSALLRALRA